MGIKEIREIDMPDFKTTQIGEIYASKHTGILFRRHFEGFKVLSKAIEYKYVKDTKLARVIYSSRLMGYTKSKKRLYVLKNIKRRYKYE